MHEWIAFLDFDGTITSEETLSGALMSLDPPLAGFDALVKRMLAREISLKEGLDLIFSSIESSRVDEFKCYISTVPIRPGFERFLLSCKERDIPVVVVSGGLDISVNDRLAPFKHLLADIWSCRLDTSGPTMKLVSPKEGETEHMDKIAIINSYDFKYAFCVGDGYTDFAMAGKADLVFARDELAAFMESKGLPYTPWDDFDDIRAAVESMV